MSALLEVRNFHAGFRNKGATIKAVHGLNFSLFKGEIVGLIGESGCGKSTTAQALILPEHFIIDGEVIFEGRDLSKIVHSIRGKEISIIFQDPLTNLNPTMSVGYQVMESLLLHEKINKSEARKRVLQLFSQMGIVPAESRFDQYPHELSGGQRQRVMIAMATIAKPKLLIADEPTTALDATIQAQILDWLLRLKENLQLTILLITHDLGVVASICDRLMVMKKGQIVEIAEVNDFFKAPVHPYSQLLLQKRKLR